MKHILFLTDNFPPEVNAPASRTFEHCREWVKSGCQVTVITCVPNFPKGKIFEGYQHKLWQVEFMAGIRVVRVWTYVTANQGFAKRSLDYLSFMLGSIVASFFIKKVDIIIGTSPQFFTVCSAYLVGIFKKKPWIFELRDIWPESIRVVGAMRRSFFLDFLEKIELFLYSKADAIVSVTHSFRESLKERGIDGKKIVVVTNGVDSSRFKPRGKDQELLKEYGLENKFVVGYIGTHGLAHSLNTILDAAKILLHSVESNDFRFIFLGDGANKSTLLQRAQSEKLENVIFVDSVSKETVVKYWSLLDASIIHLKKDPLFTTVIPSKLFECMGMGIPILHGVEGESASIVEKENIGLTFEPENAVALVEQMKTLVDNKSLHKKFRENGPLAAKKYDRIVLAEQMLGVVTEIQSRAGNR